MENWTNRNRLGSLAGHVKSVWPGSLIHVGAALMLIGSSLAPCRAAVAQGGSVSDRGFLEFPAEEVANPRQLAAQLLQVQQEMGAGTLPEGWRGLAEQLMKDLSPEAKAELQKFAGRWAGEHGLPERPEQVRDALREFQGQLQGKPEIRGEIQESLQRQLGELNAQQGGVADSARTRPQTRPSGSKADGPVLDNGELARMLQTLRDSMGAGSSRSPSGLNSGTFTPGTTRNSRDRTSAGNASTDEPDPLFSGENSEWIQRMLSNLNRRSAEPGSQPTPARSSQVRNASPRVAAAGRSTGSPATEPAATNEVRQTQTPPPQTTREFRDELNRILLDAAKRATERPESDPAAGNSSARLPKALEGPLTQLAATVRDSMQRQGGMNPRRARQNWQRLARRTSGDSSLAKWLGSGSTPTASPIDWSSFAPLILFALIPGCLALYWFRSKWMGAFRIGGASDIPAKRARLGSVRDASQLVTMVDRLTLQLFGRLGSWWHSRRLCEALTERYPGQAAEIEFMMRCYEVARYSPEASSLPTDVFPTCQATLRTLWPHTQPHRVSAVLASRQA